MYSPCQKSSCVFACVTVYFNRGLFDAASTVPGFYRVAKVSSVPRRLFMRLHGCLRVHWGSQPPIVIRVVSLSTVFGDEGTTIAPFITTALPTTVGDFFATQIHRPVRSVVIGTLGSRPLGVSVQRDHLLGPDPMDRGHDGMSGMDVDH